jgi:hypothetical protein
MSEMGVLDREAEETHTAREPETGSRVGRAVLKLGRTISAQAIPLAVGAVSFVIAVDAWYKAKPLEWEQQRALASVAISSEAVPTGEEENTAVTTVTITNVGALTFAILDMHVTLEAVGELSAAWERNSLLMSRGAALPIGLRPFRLSDGADAAGARFQFDESVQTWHVVDPGRSVDITFVQPTTGSGSMAISVNVFTQPMLLSAVSDDITVDAVVDGVIRPTSPESGEGEVSRLPVFPYSSGYILMVPRTSW